VFANKRPLARGNRRKIILIDFVFSLYINYVAALAGVNIYICVTKINVAIIMYFAFLTFYILFQMKYAAGSGGGTFVVNILNRGGRIICPRSLEPGKKYLITYVWKAGPRANTLVRLGHGDDDLWMFLPIQWRFHITAAETRSINIYMCCEM
jgi:hypothetical protein